MPNCLANAREASLCSMRRTAFALSRATLLLSLLLSLRNTTPKVIASDGNLTLAAQNDGGSPGILQEPHSFF